MNSVALGLILASAVVHASWNLLAKQVGGGAAAVWLYMGWANIIYMPLLAGYFVIHPQQITPGGAFFLFLTTVIHLAYFVVLQWAYQKGDLSLIYPLARGTVPALSLRSTPVLWGMVLMKLKAKVIVAASVLLAGLFGAWYMTSPPFSRPDVPPVQQTAVGMKAAATDPVASVPADVLERTALNGTARFVHASQAAHIPARIP